MLTGAWNVMAVRSQIAGSCKTTLVAKLAVVAISGVPRRCSPATAGPRGWRCSAR
ncbi:MAG: hypothetical protein ACRDPD_09280 [Streptosporangiaceae bacterium]